MIISFGFEPAGNYSSSLAGLNTLGVPSYEFVSLCFRKPFKPPGGMRHDLEDLYLAPTLPKISHIISYKLYGFCLKPYADEAVQKCFGYRAAAILAFSYSLCYKESLSRLEQISFDICLPFEGFRSISPEDS